jgi:betaine-aldehyde dehydrogenase
VSLKFPAAGRWISGGGAVLETVNPATGIVHAAIGTPSAADIDEICSAVARSAALRAWQKQKPHQRAAVLHKIADKLLEGAGRMAEAQMVENGKPLKECRAQAASASGVFRYYAGVCETMESAVPPARGNYLNLTTYEPYGVIAAITPWNSPLTMDSQKVAPALAAGNAVVLKPSEVTTLPALELARICEEAGLPEGLLSVLPGYGTNVGPALIGHSDIRMVTFTGGTETGRRIGEQCARRLIPMALELGGKSPHIIFEDGDIAAACNGVIDGIFEGMGQSCVAGSRLFVHRSRIDEVVGQLVALTEKLRVGMPTDPTVDLGSLSSHQHRDRVESFVALAREEGAAVATGGRRPDDPSLADGAFYLPTILTGLTNRARVCQEEIFGPVLCVLPFDDEADLIAQANDTAFGLACGIWTADYRRGLRVAREIAAGTVWINTYKQLSIAAPFGGFKDSGLGREKGLSGMRLYQQAKSIYLATE